MVESLDWGGGGCVWVRRVGTSGAGEDGDHDTVAHVFERVH